MTRLTYEEREELKALRIYRDAIPILIQAIINSTDPKTRASIHDWDQARMKTDYFKYRSSDVREMKNEKM